MESTTTTTSTRPCPSSSSPPPPSIPCAACKILRRRCGRNCLLAPYFPPAEPLKFTIAHRVFGSSNIIKSLQEVPEMQREDAVKSMVYEAKARMRDPVYGSAGAIWQLQKQVSELESRLVVAQAELAMAQAEIDSMQIQHTHHLHMLSLLSINPPPPLYQDHEFFLLPPLLNNNNNSPTAFSPLWT